MVYSTAAQVRAVLPSLLMADDEIGEVGSGTDIRLTYPAVAVPTILKDSTTLTITTDYTFVRPLYITLNTAATGEYFTAQVYRGATDTELGVIIGKADRIIDDFWYNRTTPATAILADWSSELSASIYLRQYSVSIGDKDGVESANLMEDRVMQLMKIYQDHTSKGAYVDTMVTRDDATSVNAFNLDQMTTENFETDD